ncbi:rod shape-determining protein MreD [Leptolyngbya sp. PCC 6406]|uniref:rod shape-determining protein MreD n=1 Tax=Leptolyngbya sp. PCC 6406 TaxID=1173264 RepID=UPI0002AC5E77|nr:rod shape-determining protein MreD [Leptolyngbya sp. PCC 6406]
MTAILPVSPARAAHYRRLNLLIIIGSVALCLLVLPIRPPGMEILGVGPSWLLIWVVAWSVKRTAWEGAIAGLVLGLIQDAMTGPYPSHVVSLVIVGIVTARLQKQRFIQEDFVSVALIVFGMVVMAQTAMAVQITAHRFTQPDSLYPVLTEIWLQHQRIALSSAILSSLWAPVLYYPLNRWWSYLERHTMPPSI